MFKTAVKVSALLTEVLFCSHINYNTNAYLCFLNIKQTPYWLVIINFKVKSYHLASGVTIGPKNMAKVKVLLAL